MLVILNIYTHPGELDDVVERLMELDEVVDLYEVTGDYDIVAMIEVDSIEEFRSKILRKLMGLKGVRGTNSFVVLHAHKRGGRILEE
ncbi:Lrp/AsnC family transcriptional regulator [Candidatus Korarchaeum cryptofilum]|jgi:DNA-binding Lrp family transcriptional regulator|uniref:Lrp/AsnC family transcriptional regulator n=1 Tax=Candidatus Korarchaeum cryptofilum TaxID=498846 RepID=A0A3R9QZ07_9CREN|nr:Lrp/AsnC ligand binding domain-containing protein [Candidatus Korarchaeum cryptofilum]RSN69219.1 Lrp/AsnC family transcriptional regulator [Candidatus Korarchaeum cryptofilum]